MKTTLPTGSDLRNTLHPKLDRIVEGVEAEHETADESYPRRITRVFLRYSAKLAVRLKMDEGEYMNEAHAAFHNEAEAASTPDAPTAEA